MAAALLLTACGKTNAGSGSSGSMSGSSGTSSAQTQTAAWKTGLGVVTEATDQDRAGKIELAAAAVLLDGEGKLESVLLDELEVSVSADSTGHVTLPTDWRTKRQKGDDYPLAAVSSLKIQRNAPYPGEPVRDCETEKGFPLSPGHPAPPFAGR